MNNTPSNNNMQLSNLQANSLSNLFSVFQVYNSVNRSDSLKSLAQEYEKFESKFRNLQEKEVKDLLSSIPPEVTKMLSYSSNEYRVYMDGCFDICHSGHFNAIRLASKLGDQLYMGLASDAEILINKEVGLMDINERARIVNACKWVNGIFKDVPYVPIIEFLTENKLDCIAHGDDPCLDINGEDVYKEFKKINKYREFKRTEGVSTTDIVGRLLVIGLDVERDQNNDKSQNQVKFTAPTSSGLLGTVERFRDFSDKKNYNPSRKNAYLCDAFDILQESHINILEQISNEGYNIYVGILDDRTVHELYGEHFPILNVVERSLNVLALKYVADIIVGTPFPPSAELIKSLSIDIVFEVKCTAPTYPNINLNYDPYEEAKKLNKYAVIVSELDTSPMKIVAKVMQNKDKFMKKYSKKKGLI